MSRYHVMPRAYRLQLQAQDLDKIMRIVNQSTEPDHPPTRHALTKPGDTRKLRGIPAIGRGVTGAVPGTRPGHNLR